MANKKLYRIPDGKMLGGVCSGLGVYLDLDPTIVRLIFLFLFFTGSAGFWIYMIMWIIVPELPGASYDVIDSVDASQTEDGEEE